MYYRVKVKLQKFRKYFYIIVIALAIPLTAVLTLSKTNFLPRAYFELVGTRADIIIDLSNPREPTEYPWSALAQGGEEKNGMLSSVTNKVKSLDPSYIRIDHVYDFYEPVQRDTQGKLVYDWGKLDIEIQNILATGAKPFLALSYMPESLSSGTEIDLPVSWVEWQELVKKTVEHVSGTEGLAIEDVYYEIWNEPDLYGNFKIGKGKDYLTLYKSANLGAAQAKNALPFKIGGPATTALYNNWFSGFLDFVKKENLRLNFYSWHRYSKNIADFEKDLDTLNTWLSDYPEFRNIELVISESGPNSENDPVYDTQIAAAHTLATNATLFTKLGKVFVFEIKDGPGDKQFWGRWGLLTHESYGAPLAKPRFEAISFLNTMKGYDYRVTGTGSWVKAFSTTDGRIIRLMLVNYDPFGKHIENVPVTFSNLHLPAFKFTKRTFLGDTTESHIDLGVQSSWSTRVLLQPNSAVILELQNTP